METATDSKLEILAKQYGYSSADELLEEYGADSLMPGICMNEGCECVTECELDQREGWCGACGTTTVKSALVLAGVI